MDLNSLAVFVRVVESGSFTQAARELGMPKSTVSLRIGRLERTLGVTLLRRTTRRLSVTEAGRDFARTCQESLGKLESASANVRRAEQEPSGLLRVTISVGLGLGRIGDLVNDFVRAHPKIEVDLLLTSRVVDLTTERIDVAIRAGRLSSSGHKVRRIGESEFRLFASPSYLQQHGTPARPEELTHHACLRLTFSPERMNTFELHRGKRRVRVPVRGPFSANEIGAVHKAALSGLGIAFLPITICQADVEEGRLIPVLPRWSSERTPLHLVLPAQPFVPAKARAFVDFMRRALAEQPL